MNKRIKVILGISILLSLCSCDFLVSQNNSSSISNNVISSVTSSNSSKVSSSASSSISSSSSNKPSSSASSSISSNSSNKPSSSVSSSVGSSSSNKPGSSVSSSLNSSVTSSSDSYISSSSTSISSSQSTSSDSSIRIPSNSSINSESSSENVSSSLDEIENIVTLNILEMNDMHGHAYSTTSFDLSNVSGYVNELRNTKPYDNVLLIANGDMFQGTAFSNISHGRSVINVMNELNFDMMGIGNHEFDWGLSEVLAYWDGNEYNGEASFPLINGNVRDNKNNNLIVGEDNDSDNIHPYAIVEKSGIKIGLLSYIADQTSSICQNKFGSYYIDCYGNRDSNFLSVVKSHAQSVKQQGADIVVLNIHEGNSNSPESLYYNQAFASLKDNEGDYLIDAVINGHTHSTQATTISRSGGNPLPIVQGGANCNGVGEIDITYNRANKEIDSINVKNVTDLFDYNDDSVKAVLESEYAIIKPQISEVLGVSSTFVSKNHLGQWTTNIMKQYSGADFAFINTGGIRSTGGIKNGTSITLENLYEINPFDNSLVYVTVLGSELKDFASRNNGYYYFDSSFDVSSIIDDQRYNILTIDYVYYSTYFTNSFVTAKEVQISTLCARDLMVKELKAHVENLINIPYGEIRIERNNFPEI